MKKKYIKPEIVRVKLDHEQAVIAVCSLNYTSGQHGVLDRCNSSGNPRCKASSSGQSDSGGWS